MTLPKLTILTIIFTLLFPLATLAQTDGSDDFTLPPVDNAPPTLSEVSDSYYRAKVIEITEEGTQKIDGNPQEYQILKLKITSGDKKGQDISVSNGLDFILGTFKKYKLGETVIVAHPAETPGAKKDFYYITDQYRFPALIIIIGIFFALAIYFGRKRGLTSIIGLVFSIFIIFYYIIPQILKGNDPLSVSITGAVLIILVSLFLSHGFNRRTTIALVSTLLCLGLAVAFDLAFVYLAKLYGNGTEEAFFLQFNTFDINLRGLLLGGILIGVLGVLDDVTTAQAATVEELHKANNNLSFSELYKAGLSVGREHIAALVNTLVLAYVGASFPLLILFSSQSNQPLWITLNSNFLAEEIVRTLVGSSILVIAVPLTTILAAGFYKTRKKVSS